MLYYLFFSICYVISQVFVLCYEFLLLKTNRVKVAVLSATMHTLRKRHSWPPLRKPRAFYLDETIDRDPFAYFISPAEDRDIFLNDQLAAGINDSKRSRSFSPAHRGAYSSSAAAWAAVSPTARLKKWIERMELRCFHRSPSATPNPMPSPDPPKLLEISHTVSPPLRGRRDVRSNSSHRVRRNTRSHPRRPRAWREPSRDIWPVPEEGEDVGLGIVV